MASKDNLRAELGARWNELWPDSGEAGRLPLFPLAGRATERLRRLQAYRLAQTVAVLPSPSLLQARINALNDNKSLLAATPGLKQGLVRLTPQEVPLPARSKVLRGWSLASAGKVLRLPEARAGKAGLVVGAALAVDPAGRILGDGRGLLDLFWALLMRLGAIKAKTPVVVVAADEQVVDELPGDSWDVGADIILTPTRTIQVSGAARPEPDLDSLPEALAGLPVVQAVRGMARG
ncbi:MAG: 5-formyltetrahydrofolate cyclo-ligase [Desulfarculaceae bacterium]|nr:5-formyltetrahydrofolate cyclo-ligase [Desulfarculaceae bacterium]